MNAFSVIIAVLLFGFMTASFCEEGPFHIQQYYWEAEKIGGRIFSSDPEGFTIFFISGDKETTEIKMLTLKKGKKENNIIWQSYISATEEKKEEKNIPFSSEFSNQLYQAVAAEIFSNEKCLKKLPNNPILWGEIKSLLQKGEYHSFKADVEVTATTKENQSSPPTVFNIWVLGWIVGAIGLVVALWLVFRKR